MFEYPNYCAVNLEFRHDVTVLLLFYRELSDSALVQKEEQILLSLVRYEHQNIIKTLPPEFILKECNRLHTGFIPSALEWLHTSNRNRQDEQKELFQTLFIPFAH